jgi:hypothetical protein
MHGGTSRIRPSPFRREPGCPRLASLRRQARMPARKPRGGASELSGAGTTLLLGTESGRLRRGRHSCSERFPPEDEAKDLIAEDAVLLREGLVHLLQRFGPRSSPRWATALPARSRPGTPAGPGDHRRPYATRTDGRGPADGPANSSPSNRNWRSSSSASTSSRPSPLTPGRPPRQRRNGLPPQGTHRRRRGVHRRRHPRRRRSHGRRPPSRTPVAHPPPRRHRGRSRQPRREHPPDARAPPGGPRRPPSGPGGTGLSALSGDATFRPSRPERAGDRR